MKELTRIDFKKGKFTGTSKTVYTVAESLSLNRWIQFEKIMNTFGFGKDFEAVAKDIQLAIDYFDKSQASKAIIVLNNLQNGIVRHLENRIPIAIELCSLFCNCPDEDVTIYDPQKLANKVDDWGAVDSRDFFTLGCNLVPGFIKLYEEISVSISTALDEMEKTLNDTSKQAEKSK